MGMYKISLAAWSFKKQQILITELKGSVENRSGALQVSVIVILLSTNIIEKY